MGAHTGDTTSLLYKLFGSVNAYSGCYLPEEDIYEADSEEVEGSQQPAALAERKALTDFLTSPAPLPQTAPQTQTVVIHSTIGQRDRTVEIIPRDPVVEPAPEPDMAELYNAEVAQRRQQRLQLEALANASNARQPLGGILENEFREVFGVPEDEIAEYNAMLVNGQMTLNQVCQEVLEEYAGITLPTASPQSPPAESLGVPDPTQVMFAFLELTAEPVTIRLLGVIQLAGAASEATAAVLLFEPSAGTSSILIVLAADSALAAGQQIWFGVPTKTFVNQAGTSLVKGAGADQELADILGGGFEIVVHIGAGAGVARLAFAPSGVSSSASMSRVAGRLYGQANIDALRKYLNSKNVVIIENSTEIKFTANAIGGHELHLQIDPTYYEVYHELQHVRHLKGVGYNRYSQTIEPLREQYAYDQLRLSTNLWWNVLNQDERDHAFLYILLKGGNPMATPSPGFP